MKIVNSLIFSVLAAGLIFAACDSLETDADLSESGTLRVYMTDAPVDYESVVIDIREIRVHKNADAEMEDDSTSNGDDEGEWIIISDEPQKVDLLQLTNGVTEFLGEAELEAGTYSQMRLILGDENEITVNGETQKLTTPSAQQSGLKLNIHTEIEEDRIYTLLLDFDASRSIVRAGMSGMYILKPVIKTVNLAESGAIGGTIEPAEALPWIYAIAGEDTVAGTQADDEGEFLLIGILNGTYNVAIVPDETEYNSVLIEEVEVVAPDTTFIDTVTLEDAE